MSFADKIKATVFSVFLLGFLEALSFKQQFFWAIIIPLSLAFLLAFIWILGPDIVRRKRLKMKKAILPIFLVFGAVFFVLFEPSSILRQIVIILSVLAFILFFVIYRKIPLEKPTSPNNKYIFDLLFFLLNLTAFLDFWVIFNIYSNFGLALWVGMILILIISVGLFYYLFWAGGIYSNYILTFTVLLGLVILEIFVTLSFWPVDFSTKSIILILIFYVFSGLLILRAQKEMTLSKVLEYIILFVVIFLIVILTMKWFTVF
jgi:hypothetical protein